MRHSWKTDFTMIPPQVHAGWSCKNCGIEVPVDKFGVRLAPGVYVETKEPTDRPSELILRSLHILDDCEEDIVRRVLED